MVSDCKWRWAIIEAVFSIVASEGGQNNKVIWHNHTALTPQSPRTDMIIFCWLILGPLSTKCTPSKHHSLPEYFSWPCPSLYNHSARLVFLIKVHSLFENFRYQPFSRWLKHKSNTLRSFFVPYIIPPPPKL